MNVVLSTGTLGEQFIGPSIPNSRSQSRMGNWGRTSYYLLTLKYNIAASMIYWYISLDVWARDPLVCAQGLERIPDF